MSTLTQTPPEVATPAGQSSRRVAGAVARVEGPRLLRHPATLVGIGLSTALVASLLTTIAPVLQREVVTVAMMALPLAAGIALAAHLAISRLHRDETLPLATVAASTPTARTAGLLLALAWPAALAALWTAAVLVVLAGLGGIGVPAIGDLLAPSGTVLLFGAFGVALGRWVPSATAGAFALPVLAIGLFGASASVYSLPAERLLPWADWGGFRPGLMIESWPRAPWLHLLYVLVMAGTLAGIAVLRHRRDVFTVATTLACAVGVGVVAFQMIDVWDDPALVDELVADIRDPTWRLVCHGDDQTLVCLPPGYERWAPRLLAPAADALAQVPGFARPDRIRVLVVDPHHPYELARSLPPDVVASLPADVRNELAKPSWSHIDLPKPGTVRALYAQHRGVAGQAQHLDVTLGVLAEATGFADTVRERLRELAGDMAGDSVTRVDTAPTSRRPSLMDGCAPELEAREVLTFALAAASNPAARQALTTELELRPYGWRTSPGTAIFDDWFAIPDGGVTGGTQIVSFGHRGVWSRGAATLGLVLADTATDAQLQAEWRRWTHPAATADELVAAFGLAPLASPAELANEAGMRDLDFDPTC